MRKRIFSITLLIMASVAIIISCKDDDDVPAQGVIPVNLVVDSNVSTDGSGLVEITPSAENAVLYVVNFEEGADAVNIEDGETASYVYTETGEATYEITVTAYSLGGGKTSSTVTVSLEVLPGIDPDILQKLAGDGTKRWVWAQSVGGHFGVGPTTNDFPEFFSATPNSLNPCLYDDVIQFSYDGAGSFTYTLEPGANNEVFINWTEVNRFFPSATPQQFVDECRDITDQAVFESEFTVIDNLDGTQTLDIGESFLSYWAVIPGQYQITELTEDRLAVRGISQPFNGDGPLAWYSIFVPEGGTSVGGEPLETVFNDLVWSDEFDTDGAPDPANWGYDLGNGDNGWGNGEAQSYTSDPSNVIVEGGNLKITARTESSSGEGVYYFDDFQLLNSGGMSQMVIQDFEGTPPAFTDFGGAFSQVIANPDASGVNTSATVAQTTKPQGSDTFAASFFDLSMPLDVPNNPQISVKTWSPIANAVVRLKIEDSSNGANFAEVDVTTTVAGAWEELTFDFTGAGAFNYDRIVIFFDFGNPGTAGPAYSSARIKTEGLHEFTYGRVETRAKLPTGGGTWPAIWMLGGDYLTNPWPAAGEMDIMEHVGNQQDIVFASTHDPNNFGGNARTGSVLVTGASEEFHVYEMEWTETEIKFAVDGIVYHTVSNDGTLPFNKDFFFILNVAMGGSFGGNIDANFMESTMEVDYIRMYQ